MVDPNILPGDAGVQWCLIGITFTFDFFISTETQGKINMCITLIYEQHIYITTMSTLFPSHSKKWKIHVGKICKVDMCFCYHLLWNSLHISLQYCNIKNLKIFAKIQQYKHKAHGFHTFSCFGPHIWNSLPKDLRHRSTLSSFTAKLKTFLFSWYFCPN